MFKFPKAKKQPTVEEKLIADCYTALSRLDPETAEFKKVLKNIDALQKQVHTDKKNKSKLHWPTPDAMFTGAISLASILLVLNYEKLDVVTSKAMGMIQKPKI